MISPEIRALQKQNDHLREAVRLLQEEADQHHRVVEGMHMPLFFIGGALIIMWMSSVMFEKIGYRELQSLIGACGAVALVAAFYFRKAAAGDYRRRDRIRTLLKSGGAST